MRFIIIAASIMVAFPAYAGCDIYGDCANNDPVAETATPNVNLDADAPPQPDPAKAIDADLHPEKKKIEKPVGSIGGRASDTKPAKKGSIGGPHPDAVCVDKGLETECH